MMKSAGMKFERIKELKEFTQRTKINLSNFKLLNTAFTHSSFIKNSAQSKKLDNERLEFFGDAVLKLCISEYLMGHFKDANEGELSNLRAYVVSEKILIQVAGKLKINEYLLIGKNEKRKISKSIQADAVEALLAVIYYDCGLDAVKKFILENWTEYIDYAAKNKDQENYKAVLQEYTQAKSLGLPVYKTISATGPDHEKIFEVSVYLNDNEIGRGVGNNKKEASQIAAKNAMLKINENGGRSEKDEKSEKS